MSTTKPIHIVSVSGGKDSAACLALAVQRVPRDRLRAMFIDTGNEHPVSYEYLTELEQHFDIKIERIQADLTADFAKRRMKIARDQRRGKLRWSNKRKREALSVLHPTGNPFLDLCLLQGTFPSNSARFCTRKLKLEVSANAMLDLHENQPVIIWQGTKRADSAKRTSLTKYSRQGARWWMFRPVVDWDDEQIFEYLRESGTPVNPLYGSGFSRVSCAPCIYSRKAEIALLADQYPEQIDRIRDWERLVGMASKSGFAAFFGGKEIPATPAQRRERFAVDGVVKWSRVDFRKNKQARYEDVFAPTCQAEHGLCE